MGALSFNAPVGGAEWVFPLPNASLSFKRDLQVDLSNCHSVLHLCQRQRAQWRFKGRCVTAEEA